MSEPSPSEAAITSVWVKQEVKSEPEEYCAIEHNIRLEIEAVKEEPKSEEDDVKEDVDCLRGTGSFQCTICQYSTEYQHDFNKHVFHVHNIPIGEPTEPSTAEPEDSPPTKKKRKRKKTIVSKEKFLRCKECDYKTMQKHCLKAHLAKHSDTKGYKCDLCQYETKHSTALHRHKLYQHSKDKEELQILCYYCEYVTNFHHNMKYHVNAKHTCPICMYVGPDLVGHSAMHREDSAMHSRDPAMHSGDPAMNSGHSNMDSGDIFAPVCQLIEGTETATDSVNDEHVNRNEQKWYNCTQCDYTTIYRSGLRAHMNKHSNTELKCPDCVFTTKHSTALRRHRMHLHPTNLDLGRYICAHCDFRAPFRETIKYHLNSRHTCKRCIFIGDLNTHSKEKHPVEVMIETENWPQVIDLTDGKVDGGNGAQSAVFDLTDRKIDGEKGGPSKKKKKYKSMKGMPKKYVCNLCGYATAYSQVLEKHHRNHSDEKPYECDQCEYKTKQPSSLRRHYLKHAVEAASMGDKTVPPITIYPCNECDYKTVYKNNLKLHQRKHSSVKNLQCEHCDYKTAYRNSYIKHMRVHDKDKDSANQYICDQCPFATKYEGRMVWHLQRKHSYVCEGTQKCPFCDFSTRLKWRLTIHIQRGKRETPINCQQCPFTSTQKCQMKLHKKTHFKPLKILPAANRTVYHKQTVKVKQEAPITNPNDPNLLYFELYRQSPEAFRLNTIKVLDTGDLNKPYACYQCNYGSKFKSGVQRHYQRHHWKEVRPYKCNKCQFATSTKDSLTLHHKRSVSSEVLNCHCSFSSLYKCEMAVHQKIHFDFRCTVCTYSCRTKYDMERHYLNYHNDFPTAFNVNNVNVGTALNFSMNNLESVSNFGIDDKNEASVSNFGIDDKNEASASNFGIDDKNEASVCNFGIDNKNDASIPNFRIHDKNEASVSNFGIDDKNEASVSNFGIDSKNDVTVRNFGIANKNDTSIPNFGINNESDASVRSFGIDSKNNASVPNFGIDNRNDASIPNFGINNENNASVRMFESCDANAVNVRMDQLIHRI